MDHSHGPTHQKAFSMRWRFARKYFVLVSAVIPIITFYDLPGRVRSVQINWQHVSEPEWTINLLQIWERERRYLIIANLWLWSLAPTNPRLSLECHPAGLMTRTGMGLGACMNIFIEGSSRISGHVKPIRRLLLTIFQPKHLSTALK